MCPPESGHPSTLTGWLAERARAGERACFEQLHARVGPALYGWAALRIHPELRGRLEPEEVVQETWLRALRGLEQFDSGRGTFRQWLFGVAKIVLLEALRSVRQPELSGAGSTTRFSLIENQLDTVTSATRRLARDEGLRRFLERVRALGEDEQTLTILCGLEGLSCDEAALRLGISREAAVKRWQRLRAEIVSRDLPLELLAD